MGGKGERKDRSPPTKSVLGKRVQSVGWGFVFLQGPSTVCPILPSVSNVRAGWACSPSPSKGEGQEELVFRNKYH